MTADASHLQYLEKNISRFAIPFLSLNFVTTQSKQVPPSVTKHSLCFVNKLVNGTGACGGIAVILKFGGNPFEPVLEGDVDFLEECLSLLAPKETIVKTLSLRGTFL